MSDGLRSVRGLRAPGVRLRALAFTACAGLALGGVACGGASDDGDGNGVVDHQSSALGVVAKSPVVKRNVRIASPRAGCAPVVTPSGQWNGAALATPGGGTSRVFCSYAWSSASGAAPAESALDTIAAKDGGVRAYVVHDGSNGTPLVNLPGLGLTSGTSSSGGGGGGGIALGGGGFVLGGGQQAQNGAQPGDLTDDGDGNPEGFPGCDVCGEVIGNSWLFFVLPSSAVNRSVTLDVGGGAHYNLGAIPSSVFYTPIPAGFSGYYALSW